MARHLIVRKGLSKGYYEFLRVFALTRGLDLTIDRRAAERRRGQEGSGAERRQCERRRTPPETWAIADFVVVDGSPGE